MIRDIIGSNVDHYRGCPIDWSIVEADAAPRKLDFDQAPIGWGWKGEAETHLLTLGQVRQGETVWFAIG
jgi:hypothetical protein